MELFTALIVVLIIGFLISYLLKFGIGTSIFIAFIAMLGFWFGEVILKSIFTVLLFGLNIIGGSVLAIIVLIIAILIVSGINRNNNL